MDARRPAAAVAPLRAVRLTVENTDANATSDELKQLVAFTFATSLMSSVKVMSTH